MRPITVLDTHLVIDRLYTYLGEHHAFADSLTKLLTRHTVCLVGGSIRDMVNGIPPRDFDLIIDADQEALWSCFAEFVTERNRFGGLKCLLENYTVDIWSFADNWAFRTGLLSRSVENIPRGAFYNVDSLVLDLSHQRLYAEDYNQCVQTRTLDFVVHDQEYVRSNPMPAQNVLKSFYLSRKYELDLSEQVRHYIACWCETDANYLQSLVEATIHHFGTAIYERDELLTFISHVAASWPTPWSPLPAPAEERPESRRAGSTCRANNGQDAAATFPASASRENTARHPARFRAGRR